MDSENKKLIWCRENAPDAVKSLSDEEVLLYMSSAYEKFSKEPEGTVTEMVVEDTDNFSVATELDTMVVVLSRLFGDRLAFKGGYMLSKMMPEVARQTTDIDFSIQTSDIYKSLIDAMNHIGDYFIKKGFIDHYTVKDTIQPNRSGGMDMYASDGRKVLGIDVGWHDLTFGTTTTTFDIGTLRSFTVERMLSDKVTAILSRKRFRRPKDIYDLYCITNCFDFDANLVNEYILKRTEGAGAEWKNYPFNEDIVREYERAYNTLVVKSVETSVPLVKPSFESVLDRFYLLCSRLLHPNAEMIWDHERLTFRR